MYSVILSKKRITMLLFCCIVLTNGILSQTVKWALVGTPTIEPFHDGIACFNQDGNYGGINRSGKIVIKPIYKTSFQFSNGEAVVKCQNGNYGIINVNGTFLLPPVYRTINHDEKISGLFIVTDTLGKKGVFYSSRLIIPCEHYNISTSQFPFINIDNDYLNIQDGKTYGLLNSNNGNVLIAKNGQIETYYDKKTFHQLNGKSLETSTKGIRIYRDTLKNLYGLIDKKGNIVVQPLYKSLYTPIWVNDVVQFTDYLSKSVLFNAYGKKILEWTEDQYVQIYDRCIVLNHFTNGTALYDMSGKQLLEPKYDWILPVKNDWFDAKEFNSEESKLFNAKMKRFYAVFPHDVSDGMLRVSIEKNGENYFGYLNVETGKYITPQYTKASDFVEGIAIVKKNDKQFVINKDGNVLLEENSTFSFQRGSIVSEGVIGVLDKESYTYGYIYNPLNKGKYTYKQTNSISATEETYNAWMRAGGELFATEKYVEAKDYYYRVMMANPNHVEAIVS